MADRSPTVFTIPAGAPFVDSLAVGLMARANGDPARLSEMTVLLPTRRACRSLRDAFLRCSGGKAMLLPRMMPLGDLDEDEIALAGWDEEAPGGLDLPPAISGLRRQLLLARLVMARDGDIRVDQAARLAAELARLLDQVKTERLDFRDLDRLVDLDGDLSAHWRHTLAFLGIITEVWPGVLAEEGCLDPAERRNRLLSAQAAAWSASPPPGRVIAAGSTGTIPATADLLDAVAHLPEGCVILPGLDRSVDDAVWADLPPSHPQYGMARLLDRLGVGRDGVEDWQAPPPAEALARAHFISHAMLPPEATGLWRDGGKIEPSALEGISRIEAETEQEEALAIALVMREALEEPGRTAALVTPDRDLARRVGAELSRYGLVVDDSAGRPLDKTPAGVFMRLAARLVANRFDPVSLLSVLKHPLAACGHDPATFRRTVRALEIAALRGPRPDEGLSGLRAALGEKKRDLGKLLDGLEAAAASFVEALDGHAVPVGALVEAHAAFAEVLAATDGGSGDERLWAGDDGETLAGFIAELNEVSTGAAILEIAGRDYPALFETLMAGRVVRPSYGSHPRLFVWGLLEARLQQADVLVLGGLNEESWPPEAQTGPWMSRPMMAAFGLPLPERRIGLAAHDFAQACCARNVILSRAGRVRGAPTVPSRWLLRMETCLRGSGLEKAFAANRTWAGWARALDEAGPPTPLLQPRPTPPPAVRPRKLSVSRIETWIRDPYAIYARYILGLKVLDPLDADPGAADRGTAIHEALDSFIKAHREVLPEDAYERLLDAGRAAFAGAMIRPGVRAFWWPRFERIAQWFIAYETARRKTGVMPLVMEADGALTFDAPAGPFTLTARADRLDRLPDGGLCVVDYKTGAPPSWKQVESGFSPQLTLEAAMLAGGAFADAGVPAGVASALLYLQLSGGRVPGKASEKADGVHEMAAEALDGLRRRVAEFDDPATPYLSRIKPAFTNRPGDYDHLARVREWSVAGGDEE
ncbi:MAG: double-strand break repair protein AddB [Rhodospirillales bacterium]|nr:double-strand break repair protein AddB [Rhodospirillales bacterium]